MSRQDARDYLKKHGWKWEWKGSKPRKLFADNEHMLMRPTIRVER